jgi:hypothetical protein
MFGPSLVPVVVDPVIAVSAVGPEPPGQGGGDAEDGYCGEPEDLDVSSFPLTV